MASSNLRYIVYPNVDLTKSTDSSISGMMFHSEEAAVAYANRATAQGYTSTIAIATKIVKPKPVEMITVDIASC